ncbi:MAG: guanylate kinase [Candidatus Peregrinibacteria bacterium]
MMQFSGKFFLIVGPSGVGKGTVITALKKEFAGREGMVFPITATTRDPRPQEKDGVDYLFLTKEVFEEKIQRDEFVEYATVHEKNYYGLPKEQVFPALQAGKKVIRELDIQGLWNIQKILPPENIVSLFLYPESLEILRQRIVGRSPLSDEEVQRRLETAQNEISHKHECSYQVLSTQGRPKDMVAAVRKIIEG